MLANRLIQLRDQSAWVLAPGYQLVHALCSGLNPSAGEKSATADGSASSDEAVDAEAAALPAPELDPSGAPTQGLGEPVAETSSETSEQSSNAVRSIAECMLRSLLADNVAGHAATTRPSHQQVTTWSP